MTTQEPIKLVAAVIVSDGRVLLGKRSSSVRWYKGLWDLPGGHVEPGEDEPAAIVREVFEEVGITIDRPTGEPLLRLYDRAPDGRPIAELSAWLAVSWKGQPTNADPEVHDEITWCDADKMETLHLAHPEYRALISEILGDKA